MITYSFSRNIILIITIVIFSYGFTSYSRSLEGNYVVHGTNPNGSTYQGIAVIKSNSNNYKMTWQIGSQTFFGSGTRSGNTLYINWSGGLVTYTLTEKGILEGVWANGRGSEILIPNAHIK